MQISVVTLAEIGLIIILAFVVPAYLKPRDTNIITPFATSKTKSKRKKKSKQTLKKEEQPNIKDQILSGTDDRPSEDATTSDEMSNNTLVPEVKSIPVLEVSSDEAATTATSEDDSGWTKVASVKMRKAPHMSPISPKIGSSSSWKSSTSSTQLSKKQRENQTKKEKEKLTKVAQRVEQEERFKQHKKTLIQQRIKDSYKPKSKETGAGMRAVVDENGHLVWE